MQGTPSASLSDVWDALDTVRASLTAGRWLTSRVAAYRWHTEVTCGLCGWHPHVNLIVVSRNEIDASEILRRWEALAALEGISAPMTAQHAQRVTRTVGRALRYASKGTLASHDDTRTLGDVLHDAAVLGDADACAQWAEIEAASASRRWQGTGGEWRVTSSRSA